MLTVCRIDGKIDLGTFSTIGCAAGTGDFIAEWGLRGFVEDGENMFSWLSCLLLMLLLFLYKVLLELAK